MKKFAIVLLLGLVLSTAYAQNSTLIHVTFILTSPDLPDDTSVYITGSVAQLGMWNPGKVKMESQGNHTWTKEITVDRPVSIEYKYTLGSWEREGADANGSPLSNLLPMPRRTRRLKTPCCSGPKARASEPIMDRSRARCVTTAV